MDTIETQKKSSHSGSTSEPRIQGIFDTLPSAYVEGYPEACWLDQEVADNYIAHASIGDPVMDKVVEDLASFPPSKVHALILAGMEEDRSGLGNAPQSLRDFFFDAPQPDPDWLDRDTFQPGCRAFQRNSVLILSAFVKGVLIGNDVDSSTSTLEFSRRISTSLSLDLELVNFHDIAADDVLYSLQNENYLEQSLNYDF